MKTIIKQTLSLYTLAILTNALVGCGSDSGETANNQQNTMNNQRSAIRTLRPEDVTESYVANLSERKKAVLEISLLTDGNVSIGNEISSAGCTLPKCYFEVDEGDSLDINFIIGQRRILEVGGNTSCQYLYTGVYLDSSYKCYDVRVTGFAKVEASFNR
ncbi:MAG: hypothetical protein KDD48_03345 [Bdellovibrionales bacterium]|nr:hypothetical protein [Bdellovibrionales bacterium]